jgi:hypothetical protein
LIHAIDTNVSKERRLATIACIGVYKRFTNVTPVIDIANALIVIDVASVIAKAGLSIAAGANTAVGVVGVYL